MGISQKYGPNQCFSHIYTPFIRLKNPPPVAGTVLDIHRAREIGVDNGAQGVDLMIGYHVGRDPDQRHQEEGSIMSYMIVYDGNPKILWCNPLKFILYCW